MTTKQHYANIVDPNINAIITKRFRFERLEQAVKKMEFISTNFTVARADALENIPTNKHCLVMWIRDFDVTEEEEKEGYLGHYAFITPEEMPNGIYTLACVKLNTELKYHPRRKRITQHNPNWGHPILRAVKKGKRYDTLEQINAELEALHLEYSQTSIPGENKLFLMIFDRAADPKNPTQKYVIKIVAHPEGGFTFSYKINDYKPRMGPNANIKQENAAHTDTPESTGYFASLVTLKRKKKAAPRKAVSTESTETTDEENTTM
jgi:hypothetical protein